jgi:D-arabinose 1-dehydrogenase-like Zn-dependent alcohol dehydrogenase
MTGWDSLCYAQHNTGYSVNGSFAEYVIGAAPHVGRLPEKADFAEMAPILCAGVTSYKGIKETEARPGEWLAIAGIGGLGAPGCSAGPYQLLRMRSVRSAFLPSAFSGARRLRTCRCYRPKFRIGLR